VSQLNPIHIITKNGRIFRIINLKNGGSTIRKLTHLTEFITMSTKACHLTLSSAIWSRLLSMLRFPKYLLPVRSFD
jgi:hypothetical protein